MYTEDRGQDEHERDDCDDDEEDADEILIRRGRCR